MIPKVEIIVCLLFLALTPLSAIAAESMTPDQTQGEAILRGIVTMDQPVSGGTILIYEGLELIQTERNLNFYNGTFSVHLNPLVAKLLASRDLRVKVLINQSNKR